MWGKISAFIIECGRVVPILVTLASFLTAMIPNPTSDQQVVLTAVHNVLDCVAMNVANNTPAK